MKSSKNAGEKIAKIFYVNRRLFNKFLKEDERIIFSAEQRKILTSLWESEPKTLTDLSIDLGLAKNTLTKMLLKMEQDGLISSYNHSQDGRKKLYVATELGKEQEIFDKAISVKLSNIFYKNFSMEEMELFEFFLKRIEDNLVKENDKIL